MANAEKERELIQRRLLGRGLRCSRVSASDVGRDLEVVNGPEGLDLDIVSGTDNLAQCLQITLTTLLGSDVFNVDFGFDGLNALVTESDPVLLRERIRVAVIQVLRRETRIRRIVDVKLGDGALEVAAPGSRELNVRVVFETVAGDKVAANLGGLGSNAQ